MNKMAQTKLSAVYNHCNYVNAKLHNLLLSDIKERQNLNKMEVSAFKHINFLEFITEKYLVISGVFAPCAQNKTFYFFLSTFGS